MNVLIVADGHYYRDKNGIVYAQTTYDYSFYKRYLTAFDKVYAVVRIENVDIAPKGLKKSSGDNVEFLPLPAYTGPWQYARVYFKLRKMIDGYCKIADCAIFRIPAATSNIACSIYKKTKKPYAVEVVIDPWMNFSPRVAKSILRPLIRISWTSFVKRHCMLANGVSYVTEKYLQSKYPCKAFYYNNSNTDHFTSFYSSVELPDDDFGEPRVYEDKSEWSIVHIANTFADYGKGHITLLKALQVVYSKGYQISAYFIGDGPKKDEFIQFANELGIGEIVHFIGRLPSAKDVKNEVAKHDIFAFPTFAEGLPRGLLEAMSEGLPCLSSPTCGIPEVLGKEYLYEYNDYLGFANGIIDFINNPGKMSEQSRRNIETAKKYSNSILEKRRTAFYQQLKDLVNKKRAE